MRVYKQELEGGERREAGKRVALVEEELPNRNRHHLILQGQVRSEVSQGHWRRKRKRRKRRGNRGGGGGGFGTGP